MSAIDVADMIAGAVERDMYHLTHRSPEVHEASIYLQLSDDDTSEPKRFKVTVEELS